MKLKKLKRGLSALLAGLIAVSSVGITSSFLVVADDTDYSNIFTYQAATGYYALKGLVDNYQDLLGGITEITLPETYNDLPCALNASTFQNNTYFTKVTVPSSYEALNGFNGCSSIKEIVLLNEEQVSFKLSCLKNCTALETLKIYASSLASNPTVATFTNVPTTAVAYVKNDTVKEQLVNWPGTIVVDPSMGGEETTEPVNYTALDTAIADGEAVDTTKYTDDSVKALTDAIVAGKAVKENADATQDDVDSAVQTLVAAIDALEELPTASSDVYLWTGTYSRSGGLDTTSITDNMTVTSSSGYITFKGIDLSNMLKPYIEVVYDANDSADTLYVSTSSWSTVINSSSDEVTTASLENFASSTAFIVTTNNKSGTYGIIKSVKFYDAAYVAPTDFTELESAITEAEAIDTTNYTEDSVKALTDAIAAAKTVLANADATQDEVDAATKAITDAIAGLEELPAASSDVYLWTGTYSRSSGLDTTSITDNMTVTSSSGYITFKGIDLSNMLKPYIEVVFDANDSTDTLYVSTSSWSTVINSSSDEVTTASLENFASSTAFIVTTNNKSGTYGIIKSVKFYDAAVSPKTVVATYEIGAENASDVIAAIYDDGSVVISGTGAMTDYTLSGNGGPWHDDYASIITTVEIGEGVTNIGNYAFFDFGSLVDVSLPSTLTSVGDGAFRKCTALTSVEIPEGVTSLGNGAFYSCSSLTSINIPNGVTSMPGNTFNGCTSLTGDIYIPSAITLLVSTFYNCSDPNLNVYIMGESVKIDSNNVFNNFTGTVYVYDLTTYNNVYIRYKNVFLIGEKGLNLAITKAEALDSSIYTDESWTILETALNAAKSVAAKENATETEISEALSSLNSAIDSLVYGDHGALVGGPWDISLNGDYSVVATLYNDQTLVISGTGATKNCNSSSYQNTNTCPWYSYASSITGIVVTEGVTSVGDYLFSGYSKINSVELASSVTSIGTYTFRSCVLLENVTLSNSLQSIGSVAFLDCSALKNLYFPGSLTTIGQQAFGRCTSLISVEFDDASNPSFGIMVFNGCSGLKSVKLSSKLTSIGQSMFYDCTALETISFPEELTSIGDSAFYNCNLSGDITIPSGVTVLNNYTFRNNTSENLNFYILGEVTSIGSNPPFYGCAGKIYVYSDTTYNIIAASNHGTAEVIYIGTDLSTVNLKAAIADGEAVVTAKYTDDSVKTLTDAITTGKTVLENTNATQEEIDAATQAIKDAIEALVEKPLEPSSDVYTWTGNWTKQTGLVDAGTASGMTVANTGGGWQMLISDVDISLMVEPVIVVTSDATNIQVWYGGTSVSSDNSITQFAKSGEAVSLENYKSQTKFTLSGSDTVCSITSIRIYDMAYNRELDYTALNQMISNAEAIDTDNYTSYSIAVLNSAVESAKAILADENATQEAIDIAVKNINDAIAALKDKSFEANYIVKVEKSGAEAVLDTFKADDSTAGAVKVKITFDCAEDVNFNKYANIEVKAVVNGTESYQKISGTGEESEAVKGEQGIEIELPLTNAIASGNDVKLSAFTWCFSNAIDYVYGITKVEYINENGEVVRTITNATISLEELKSAIAEGEAIDSSLYTADSYAVLTSAIGTAKAVLANAEATQEDIDAATQAIENAIAALEYKPGVTGSIAGTILVSDKDNSTEMTVTAVSADGTETSVTATSMGTYTLEGLEAGEYTLTISGGKYAPRTYEVTVEAVDLAFDVELNPLGDINGDGAITTADVGMANSHAKGVQSLEGYKFVCADVKIDGSITTADVGMINSHAKSVSTLW